MRPPAVLVINARLAQGKLAQVYPDFEIHTLPWRYSYVGDAQSFDDNYIQEYLRAAEVYCRTHDIKAIVAINDMGALLAVILNNRLGLLGPSEVAVLHCTNKFLLRKSLATPPEDFFPVTIESDSTRLSYPFFIKAPYSAFGMYAARIETKRDLETHLKTYWSDLVRRNEVLRYLLQELSIINLFPEALTDMFYGERLRDTVSQLTVEAIVQAGEVSVIAIADSNMTADGTVFESFSVPAAVPPHVTRALIEQTAAVITGLGLDNTGCNIEWWWQPDGSIDLIEVNARISHSFKRLYHAGYGFDVLDTAIRVALGWSVAEGSSRSEKLAGLYNIRVRTGGQAKDVFNYPLARSMQNVSIRFHPDRYISRNGHYGDVIADVLVTGPSRATMDATATTIRKMLQL